MSKRSKRIKRQKRNPIEGLTPYVHRAWWNHFGIEAWKRYDRLDFILGQHFTYGMHIECPVSKRIYEYTRDEMEMLMKMIGNGMEPKLAVRTSTFAKIPLE